MPWLPLTFVNRTRVRQDPFLANVKVESQAEVGGEQKGNIGETEPLIPSKTVNHAE